MESNSTHAYTPTGLNRRCCWTGAGAVAQIFMSGIVLVCHSRGVCLWHPGSYRLVLKVYVCLQFQENVPAHVPHFWGVWFHMPAVTPPWTTTTSTTSPWGVFFFFYCPFLKYQFRFYFNGYFSLLKSVNITRLSVEHSFLLPPSLPPYLPPCCWFNGK